jgi:hypothetical protein
MVEGKILEWFAYKGILRYLNYFRIQFEFYLPRISPLSVAPQEHH